MENYSFEKISKKYPYMKQIFLAIENFRKTGKKTVRCFDCNNIINIKEDKDKGFLETSCVCGKSKSRMRWDPNKT